MTKSVPIAIKCLSLADMFAARGNMESAKYWQGRAIMLNNKSRRAE